MGLVSRHEAIKERAQLTDDQFRLVISMMEYAYNAGVLSGMEIMSGSDTTQRTDRDRFNDFMAEPIEP